MTPTKPGHKDLCVELPVRLIEIIKSQAKILDVPVADLVAWYLVKGMESPFSEVRKDLMPQPHICRWLNSLRINLSVK